MDEFEMRSGLPAYNTLSLRRNSRTFIRIFIGVKFEDIVCIYRGIGSRGSYRILF